MHLLTLVSWYTIYLREASSLLEEMPCEAYFCFQAHVIPWERAALPEYMQLSNRNRKPPSAMA